MEMDLAAGKRLCVTGASGYIASWIVKLLLQRGYTVNATVRSLTDSTKSEHLVALDGAKERLHLFQANLLDEGSFNNAIQGCNGVFHIASPVLVDSPNPQADIIDPALKGTLNVLTSCAKNHVKRVVLTSSTSAMIYNDRSLTDEIVDETWFSTPKKCMESKYGKWYMLSKTMAESAAWKFAEEKGIDMVVINPAMVIGPMLQPTLNFSTAFILSLINGSKTFPNAVYGWVHVKDVAEAHIRAFEIPSANGRYPLSVEELHTSELVKILQELYPNLILPQKCDDDQLHVPTYKISKDKAKTLGMGDNYIPLSVGLKETVECLKEKKFFT